MKSTQQLTIYRTALLMQGIIHRTFEKIENGEEVSLKRLEEVLRLFLILMNQVQDSPHIDIDSTVKAVMTGCGEKRGNLKILYPKKKRLLLFAQEPVETADQAG
ncbi:MAG: hypothetical protein HPY50_13730 [Firmicutes bacterium]|nr:hypothetical protein [Bacillota bacterium]